MNLLRNQIFYILKSGDLLIIYNYFYKLFFIISNHPHNFQ